MARIEENRARLSVVITIRRFVPHRCRVTVRRNVLSGNALRPIDRPGRYKLVTPETVAGSVCWYSGLGRRFVPKYRIIDEHSTVGQGTNGKGLAIIDCVGTESEDSGFAFSLLNFWQIQLRKRTEAEGLFS